MVGPPQLDHFSGKASSTLHAPNLDKQQLSSCIVVKFPCSRLNYLYMYCDKVSESWAHIPVSDAAHVHLSSYRCSGCVWQWHVFWGSVLVINTNGVHPPISLEFLMHHFCQVLERLLQSNLLVSPTLSQISQIIYRRMTHSTSSRIPSAAKATDEIIIMEVILPFHCTTKQVYKHCCNKTTLLQIHINSKPYTSAYYM